MGISQVMLDVTTTSPSGFGAPMAEFVRAEIRRVGAPATEIEAALAFVAASSPRDIRAYQRLSPRMRRLVDLVGVVGREISPSTSELGCPADA